MQTGNRSIVLVLVAALAAVTFHDLSRRYDGFRLWDGPPAGYEPHPLELSFFVWYIVLGGVAAVCISVAAIARSEDANRIDDALRRLVGSPWFLPGACLAVLAGALAVKDLVLAGAPISDDESVYVFIAKTLALGRVANPPPDVAPGDLGHFATNFVVLTERAWFGKYPIGHPAVLALGEIVGARTVVGPLLAVATLLTTHAIARRLLGKTGAALAAVLVVVSPQLVFTAATETSQNSSQLAMLLGLLALLRAEETEGARQTRELALAGAALGFGVLARPLPGVLFVLASAGWVLFGWTRVPVVSRLRALIAPGLVLSAFAALFGFVNWRQTGDPLSTGYQAVHGRVPGVDPGRDGIFSGSVAGALLRQLVWAFGWPVSLAFVPFAARARSDGPSLVPVWLFLAAGYAYRLTTPKVYVGSTGPIYVAEMVPLLAILTAAGMLHVRRVLVELRPAWSRAVGGLAVGSSLCCVSMFLPFQVAWLRQIAEVQRFTPDVLAARGVERALVFSTNVAEPGASWALHPPPPPPGLDEPIIYVRKKRSLEANVAFWQRYFPDRAAFVLEIGGGMRSLKPLQPGSDTPFEATPGPSR